MDITALDRCQEIVCTKKRGQARYEESVIAAKSSRKPIKPGRLRPGATIAVAAPAGAFDPEVFNQGLAVLRDIGFQTRTVPSIFSRRGYLAGDDRERAAQLMAAWAHESVDAVICARGGYGSLRTLPYLDVPGLVGRPIPFIGFSDISAIHQQLNHAGLVSFHGPTVCTLAKAGPTTRRAFVQALTAEGIWPLPVEHARCIRGGRAQGVLVGGNLTTLCHLLATPFARSYANRILFLEDIGETPYRIDRMLVQMKMAGCFTDLAGLILGSFQNCGSFDDIVRIIGEVLGDLQIPMLAGLPAGHEEPNLTLPLGIRVSIDADLGELELLEPPTANHG